jgi:hypothetical protein
MAIDEQFVVSLKSPFVLTADTVKGAVPELVSTMLDVLLGVPRSWSPKERGVAANPRMGTAMRPVPDSAKMSGLFSALEVMVRVPVLGPTALGVKTMFNVQLAWSAREERHPLLEAIWKSPEPAVKLGAMPLIPEEAAL